MNLHRIDLLVVSGLLVALACTHKQNHTEDKTTYLTFHRIPEARVLGAGEGVRIAVLDWMFDMSPEASKKYVDAVSLVPGQDIGAFDPWHGEWMAEIIHTIAPEAKIIPIRARPKSTANEDVLPERPYEQYLIQGIRYAADHGAAAVTSSMGPVKNTPALDSAVAYAAEKGTVFIDVHPEYKAFENRRFVFSEAADLNPLIIHSGIVSVPDHPREPDSLRDVCTWPYAMDPVYKDGWGYSNGPPIVAGVVALMKSVHPGLTVPEIKAILIATARMENGFRVMDGEAAVKEAARRKSK